MQVHFGGGFLKPSPLHGNCWVQQIPCPTSAMKVLKCLSMVSTQDYQGDLKASLAGGVCNTTNVFAYRLYCIRLCHPNKIYLLTYSGLLCLWQCFSTLQLLNAQLHTLLQVEIRHILSNNLCHIFESIFRPFLSFSLLIMVLPVRLLLFTRYRPRPRGWFWNVVVILYSLHLQNYEKLFWQ